MVIGDQREAAASAEATPKAFASRQARQGESSKGARAETGVVVLNDAMISEFFESRPTALSDE
jgi:hypothetical protein